MIDDAVDLLTAALSGDRRSIMVLAAVYVFLVCGYSCIHQLRIRGWPGTIGKLRRAGLKKFGAAGWVPSEQEYISDALYDYEVDQVVYEGKRVSPWIVVASHNLRFLLSRQIEAIDADAEGNVTVYYNPAKPEKSVLVVPGTIGIVLTFIICVGPLIWILLDGGSSG